jgi:hypothetical protein
MSCDLAHGSSMVSLLDKEQVCSVEDGSASIFWCCGGPVCHQPASWFLYERSFIKSIAPKYDRVKHEVDKTAQHFLLRC